MLPLLCTLLLCAPSDVTWSEAHDIGVRLPKSWTILARDQGAQAFVVEGPPLSGAKPHLVIWNMGEPGDRSLEDLAKQFDEQVSKRPGWTRTAFADHEVGPWRAKRLAYAFTVGGTKARARVSVIYFGGRVYVLEMSGAVSGFPGATFDRIEKSIEARWEAVKLAGGATTRVPPGWQVLETEKGVRVAGPRGALVVLQRDAGEKPEGVEERGTLEFLGEKRPVFTVTREVREEKVQLRWVHHGGWTGVILMPVAAWDDVGPGARAILAALALPQPRDGKQG